MHAVARQPKAAVPPDANSASTVDDSFDINGLTDEILSWLNQPAESLDRAVSAVERARIRVGVASLNELARTGDQSAFYAQQFVLSRIYLLHTVIPDQQTAEGSVALHEVTRLLEDATIAAQDAAIRPGTLEQAPTDPKAYLSWMRRSAKQHRVYKHPYYREFIRNHATVDDLRAYVIQESVVDGRFDDLLAMMQVGTNGAAKMEIANNFWDEMGNGDSAQVHTMLFNNIFQVYDKSGGLQCSALLNNFLFGTSDALTDPRSLYDNLNNRFAFTVAIIPASASAAPAQWLAVSQSGNPCGGWFIYRVGFAGGLYPAGALLDYPYLGQDRTALNLSSNSYDSAGNFIGDGAFSVPKSAVYNGQGFSFSSSSVAFSTAPVNVAGIPMQATSTTYWLASVPGTGYDLYRMNSGGGPLTLQAVISAPFSAPTRDANQPGTSTVIDVLDGRLDWPPVQDNGFVWFAHGIDDSGFPTVRLGAINAGSNTVQTAEAFHSGSSDDFDPSIGIADNPGGGIYAWLNWGYTDTPNGVAASDTVNGITPGQGVPNEIGTDRTLVTGFLTNQIDFHIGAARFGDNTSVSVDPSSAAAGCPVGRTAVTDNQFYDSNGSWVTRVGRESFC